LVEKVDNYEKVKRPKKIFPNSECERSNFPKQPSLNFRQKFSGDQHQNRIGSEVEYGVTHRGSKLSAECIHKLAPNSIPREDIKHEILNSEEDQAHYL
ncbi:hypothetical protein CEXT_252981, partial [Caerostris extrusa]